MLTSGPSPEMASWKVTWSRWPPRRSARIRDQVGLPEPLAARLEEETLFHLEEVGLEAEAVGEGIVTVIDEVRVVIDVHDEGRDGRGDEAHGLVARDVEDLMPGIHWRRE